MGTLAAFTSCEVDNYALPDATITGTVIDAKTGKGLVTEQPNGFQIRHEQISWSDTPSPLYFWGRADGTYTNTKMFAGTYKITPYNGAFVIPEAQTVELKSGSSTQVDFTVTPYLSFGNVSIVKVGSTVEVTFTISKNVSDATLNGYRVFATSKTPYVGNNTNCYETSVSTGEVALTEDMLDKPIKETLSGFTSGKTYYIRVGARVNAADGHNPSFRYNMTEIVSITF
jgi:hypothetical protein